MHRSLLCLTVCLLAQPTLAQAQPTESPAVSTAPPAPPAYQVEAGQVVEASRAGISNLLFGVTAGIGWFIPRAGVTPFARVGAVWHTPVSDQVMLRFVLNLGVEVRL